jgi:hypothetical protein
MLHPDEHGPQDGPQERFASLPPWNDDFIVCYFSTT